jgi:hypothetical protein
MVTLDGKEYKPLADGKYDVIILGSGFKECLLAGLLAAVGGKKVLQIDRNQQYGGDCGSLNLEEMCKRHNVSGVWVGLLFAVDVRSCLLFSFNFLCNIFCFFFGGQLFLLPHRPNLLLPLPTTNKLIVETF